LPANFLTEIFSIPHVNSNGGRAKHIMNAPNLVKSHCDPPVAPVTSTLL